MLNQWWSERNQREQLILTVGGIFVVILLVYTVLWKPLTKHIQSMQTSIQSNYSLLSWMKSASNKVLAYRSAGYEPHKTVTQPVLVTIEQSLMQNKLSQHVSSTAQQNNHQISIMLNNVPFDKMIDWLQKLWTEDNITVSRLAIKKTQTLGIVNATMNLSH